MTRRLRVLSIAHVAVNRRAGRFRYHPLANRPDLDVHLLVPQEWREYGRVLRADPPDDPGITVHIRPVVLGKVGAAGWYCHLYPGLGRLIREIDPDVIHLAEEPWGFLALQAYLLRGRASLVFEVDQNVLRRLPQPFEAIRRFVLPRSGHLLSRTPASTAVAEACGYRGGVTLIGYGVDTAIFRPGPPAERPAGPLHLGYVGRLVHEKGLDDVLDAMAAVAAPIRLSIMGEGPHETHLRRRVAELGLQVQVSFTPWAAPEAVAAFIRRHDALVLPTRTIRVYKEQFGRVIIEAQACGVPVIGSDCGAIPDVVGEGGWIVPERRPDALAALLAALAKDPGACRARGTAGIANVARRFTYQATADALAEAYWGAAGAGTAGEPEVVEVVSEFGTGGGVERVAYDLAHALAARSFPTRVITGRVSDAPRAPIATRVVGGVLSRIPTRGGGRYLGRSLVVPLFTLAATLALRGERRRVVISHGDCLAGDIVVVHAVNAASVEEKRRAGSWRWRLNPMHLWIALRDRVMIGGLRYRYYVALSHRIAQELRRFYGVPDDRIVHIPNGVDLDRLQPDPVLGARTRARLGLPADAKVLLFVGHEFERKGLGICIDALHRLDPSWRLVVVGSDAPEPYRARAGAREADVIFAGEQADVLPFYAAADALVLPTVYEAFPMVCVEALACGVPLFATRVGGIEEYLVDGINGYAVTRDASAIAETLTRTFADPGAVARLRMGARQSALRYGLTQVAESYAALIRRVAAEKRDDSRTRGESAARGGPVRDAALLPKSSSNR